MSDPGEHDHNNMDLGSNRPGAVRRALQKVKNSTNHSPGTKPFYGDDQEFQQQQEQHPHPQTEDVVNTIGFSLVQEIMQYLKGPDGEAAMEVIFKSQSRVAARIAVSEDAKLAARVAAEEATSGTYDGVQTKFQELFSGLPASLVTVGSVVLGSYVVLLSVGVLFSLWRFALFGLQ